MIGEFPSKPSLQPTLIFAGAVSFTSVAVTPVGMFGFSMISSHMEALSSRSPAVTVHLKSRSSQNTSVYSLRILSNAIGTDLANLEASFSGPRETEAGISTGRDRIALKQRITVTIHQKILTLMNHMICA